LYVIPICIRASTLSIHLTTGMRNLQVFKAKMLNDNIAPNISNQGVKIVKYLSRAG